MPVKWIKLVSCPLCECQFFNERGRIDLEGYKFGRQFITLPKESIHIRECSACSLFFKSVVPTAAYLKQVLDADATIQWHTDYDFYDEVELVRKLSERQSFDVLDIGGGDGQFLRMLNGNGRRSLLDIVDQGRVAVSSSGEAIVGLLDSTNLRWSGEPYDIVTAFDVFEHFYNPVVAFSNLRSMVKQGGYLILETGNAKSGWPAKYGVHNWWYSQLFEHHIFWTSEVLKSALSKYGFKAIVVEHKRHKAISETKAHRRFREMLKEILFRCAPRRAKTIAQLLRGVTTGPINQFSRDHFRVTLRRVDS